MHEALCVCDKHDTRLLFVDLRNLPREGHFIANNIYISKKIPSHSHFLLRVWERFKSKDVTNSTRMNTFVQGQEQSSLLSHFSRTSSAELLHYSFSIADLLQSSSTIFWDRHFHLCTLALSLSVNDYIPL